MSEYNSIEEAIAATGSGSDAYIPKEEVEEALDIVRRDQISPEKADAIETVQSFAKSLEDAPRQGAVIDDPEGTRYIMVSDTLAKELVAVLVAVEGLLGNIHE